MSDLPIGRAVRSGERFCVAEVQQQWTERRAAILAEYARTRSKARTAERFGITEARVRQIVQRHGSAA